MYRVQTWSCACCRTPPEMLCWLQVQEAGKKEEQPQTRVQACIFKVGDDCRQDVLALQVVGLLLVCLLA